MFTATFVWFYHWHVGYSQLIFNYKGWIRWIIQCFVPNTRVELWRFLRFAHSLEWNLVFKYIAWDVSSLTRNTEWWIFTLSNHRYHWIILKIRTSCMTNNLPRSLWEMLTLMNNILLGSFTLLIIIPWVRLNCVACHV